MNITQILNADVEEIFQWYSDNYIKNIPMATDYDLISEDLGDKLSEYCNNFVYFDYILSILEAKVRISKAEKSDDAKILLMKRDIFAHFAEEQKFYYNALSRMCTIKIESNKQLNMY